MRGRFVLLTLYRLQRGKGVIVVGRRQDRLDAFVKEHGEDKAKRVAFDIGNLDKIPEFAAEVMQQSPDIDSVFINAGTQTPLDLTKPFDLSGFHEEIKINFSSFVALTHAFLPYPQKKSDPTSFVYTGSLLSIVPGAWIPAYSASKAALNAFAMCLRDQLRHSTVKVIERSPPVVQTELHDWMGESGCSFGMPLAAFTERAYEGLAAGKDEVIVDSIGHADVFNDIVDKRRAAFTDLAKMLRGGEP
ncbi:oxidoreductase [Aspergillus heteromorphus CBS 117.55]|uniref:Oxidoreductase n=1 Tax=Aspergillus heteromorphus CBS 117.55 TaxID=1448321 RepID=A0A317V9V5_9EURO|nr:oxidoreductase [Aspergillus heteromorphus CBS 117.55]PWY70996.1 oxidoreductase [Aspergillus heteromorphus CBS 117.55]